MKKIISVLLLVLFPVLIYPEQKISLDNRDIHEYKGVIGKWTSLENFTDLDNLLKKNNITLAEFKKINNIKRNPAYPNYYFIPYSDNYLNELKSENITRKLIAADEDSFIWPITDPEKITSVVGFRNGKFHPGLDIPGYRGMPILASMEGVVLYSGYTADTGYGNIIIIKHKDNFYTRYAHNMVNFVKKNDFVKKGQIIGLVGGTGHSTGNHLHFELRCNNIPLDSLDFLPKKDNLNIVFALKNWK